MANDLPAGSPTDANGTYLLGPVDPATGIPHFFEGGTTSAITGSPTGNYTMRLVIEAKDGGIASIGNQADAGWSSGSGSLVALCKAIAAALLSGSGSLRTLDGSGTVINSTANALNVAPKPETSGGTSDFHLISAASTNANTVKASAGQVYGYEIGNNGAADCYVKLYNKASNPTVGTDTAFRTIYVPKGQSVRFHTTVGIAFGTGIALAITANMVNTDATAVAVNQVSVDIDYI